MIPDGLKTKLIASWALSRISWSTLRSGTRILKQLRKEGASNPAARANIQAWARSLCRSFNVRVTVQGSPLETGPGILVSNHMSYIDIPVLCSIEPLSFVAKSEVRSYPFIGPCAEGFGVIFIDRESADSRRGTGETLRRAVEENGRRVVVFPEGTTSLRGLPWRAGVFKLAHENQLPMQAMSICYRPADKVAFEMPSLLEHAMSLPKAGPIEAIITFSEPFVVKDFLADFERWEQWNKETLSTKLKKQGL
jgi:1-acyl-sn-glycerol-3-phosphate acyltransferase